MQSNTLIIGAGVSGLAAARTLHDANHSVMLLDKGRGVGGRAATRKLGDREAPGGRWDHGAQYFTLRSPALRQTLTGWGAMAPISPWHTGPDGTERLHATEGFNAFPKALANGLPVHTALRVVRLVRSAARWTVHTDSGERFSATTLICTLPAPQLVDLLRDSELAVPPSLCEITYQRNLTLMAELDGPAGLPPPGCLRPESGILHRIVDNARKGISKAHTVTAQATPAFSLEWYDRDRATAASVLRAALQEILSHPIHRVQIHGWKFSEPIHRHPRACLKIQDGLWAAGDGFMAGDPHVAADHPPRIESALLSGIAAANAVLN